MQSHELLFKREENNYLEYDINQVKLNVQPQLHTKSISLFFKFQVSGTDYNNWSDETTHR